MASGGIAEAKGNGVTIHPSSAGPHLPKAEAIWLQCRPNPLVHLEQNHPAVVTPQQFKTSHQRCWRTSPIRQRTSHDVPEVVEGVVNHVRGKGGDGKVLLVAAHAGSLPLVAGNSVERIG